MKEFFNAQSLIDRLVSVRGFNLSDSLNNAINQFLTEKPRVQTHGATIENYLSALRSTVEIRECLLKLRTSEELSDAKSQEVWLSDIAVEQYAFTLVSQLVPRIAEENLGWGQLRMNDQRWAYGLETLRWTVRHVQYSAFHEEQCAAVEEMYELIYLLCWNSSEGYKSSGLESLGYSVHESRLLLKSVLERTLRLTESYTETVTELFPPTVREIGRAAGVATHAVEVFAEADVRANIVFQVSSPNIDNGSYGIRCIVPACSSC